MDTTLNELKLTYKKNFHIPHTKVTEVTEYFLITPEM